MTPVEPERRQRIIDAILLNPPPKPADLTTLEAWLDPDMAGTDRLYEAVRTDRTVEEFKQLLKASQSGGLDVELVKRAVVNVAKRHGLAKDPPVPLSVARIFGYSAAPAVMDAEIAAEYVELTRG
jgi:hypothetical protein